MSPKNSTEQHLDLLTAENAKDEMLVVQATGCFVGCREGCRDGCEVGSRDGCPVGLVGVEEGWLEGLDEGRPVGYVNSTLV